MALAFGALMHAYVTSDFSVLNVINNSHSTKPLLYKISGVWGNHEGSMLLWVLILAAFGAAVAVFLDRHAVEDGGGGGEIGAQAFGIAAIDARVILFGADRKGQNLLFRQIGKAAAVAEGGKHGTPFLE